MRAESDTTIVAGVALVVAVHLAALVVFPDGLTLVELAVMEVGLAVVVALSLAVLGDSSRFALAASAGMAGSAVAGWSLWAVAGTNPWLSAGALGAIAAIVLYGVHRYELLTLGLLEEPT